jgi:hypothetical protein
LTLAVEWMNIAGPSRSCTDRPHLDPGANAQEADVRTRERVLQSLEKVYRSAFAQAEEKADVERMQALDVEYQRDQIQLEVLLDIRDLLLTPEPDAPEDDTASLLEKAQKIRKLTRFR